ncbi:DUF4268 domain-containing protein [Vaginella massiliensis]|uniref:DUF4268 domain-containing protein n=1 Tax=Vaginella massiliensis TaxID=1816680 RepID=UPI000B9B8883|nr:DUF4268 domain-containing protein [Vaginella massiliensis]
MFSKEEATKIKKEFWTAYGSFMKLHPNANGERVNWINYNTGVKGIYFKTNVENKHAEVSITIAHPDPDFQEMIWDQLEEYNLVLNSYLGEDWIWSKKDFTPEGKPISTIRLRLENVSVFRESDWPSIIRFFKEHMLNLDSFWVDHQDSFEIFK